MNKIIKDQIDRLKPSATLAINEESNKLIKNGKKVYKFGFGQSPFPVPETIVSALKNNAKTESILNKKLNPIEICALFKRIIRDFNICNCLLNSAGITFL